MKLLANSLKEGDTIGVIAPSKPFNQEKKFELDNFIKYMQSHKINIRLSKNFYSSDKYGVSAGTPEERANDINTMFSDNNIDAIWCLQGGETANQTLDLIDFDVIKKNPKLIMGKSDIDILLLAINKLTSLITIHCCDPKIGSNKELDFDYSKKWFKKRLLEKSKNIEPNDKWFCLNEGSAEGKIIGCNLISILKLAGTRYFPDFNDSIFFIETYKSNPTKLIVQLSHLKQLNVFEKTNGIVIGNNYGFQSNEFKVESIINEFLEEYEFPIIKINEFGHYQPHAFLPIGAKVKIDTTSKAIKITQDFLK